MSRCITFAILASIFIQYGCSILLTGNDPASLRLQDGADRCQGLVQFYDQQSSTFLQACNAGARDEEAEVICRQLDCDTANAKKVDSTTFGYTGAEYFTLFTYSCSGNEVALSVCSTVASVNCTTNNLQSAVAVDCSGGTQTGDSGNTNTPSGSTSKAFIIIAGSIVGGIILIIAIVDIALLIYCAYRRRRESGLDLYIY